LNIKHRLHLRVFLMILLFITMTNNSRVLAESFNAPSLLDVSNQVDSKKFYMNLDGEWRFFEELLLTPDEVGEDISNELGRMVFLPSSFETQTGKKNSFGTYSTNIKIPKHYVGKTLAIHIPYQYSAYALYMDEIEIARNGTVGQDRQSHIAEMAPRTGYFIAQSDVIQLTIQISSFDHIRGGFENSIYIGEASVVTQKTNTKMISILFVNGGIFIIGLYMILVAWYRRQEHLFFLFGLFAMLIAIRALFTVPFYYTFIFDDMSWLSGTRIEYIVTELSTMVYMILMWKWHEGEFSKKFMWMLTILHVALIITTLFTQPVFFQKLFFNIYYLAIPTFFYIIYVIAKSIRNNNRNAKVNLFGMVLIFLAFFNDYALGQNWYQSVELMLPTVGFYVMIHIIMLSRNFARSIRKMEEQNKQLIALNASNEELTIQLQNEMKQKDSFLANTSHELRNPLHGIINISQSILLNRPQHLDEKTKSDLELQLSIGRHMSRTLEDLLDITRLKEHRIHLQIESIRLQSLSIGIVDMLKVLTENKSIQIESRIPTNFPSVAADKNRLIQILFNLLHNAVKYTDEGLITIDADIQDAKAHIYIADTGIGIHEEILHKVFEPYQQGDSSITARGGGLGLGLSICQQLVELHGGTINASSILGKGSVFTLTLPLAEDYSEEQVAASISSATDASQYLTKETTTAVDHKMVEAFHQPSSASYQARILAVDDDPVNLQVLKNILSEHQYEVEAVTSGKEALKLLEWKDWDLVITDVMMPNMSGYDLTRAIREKFSISELPILLLTARSNPEDIYTGFLAGANDYVTKPVYSLELNIRVHALTNLQESINERLRMEAAWLQAQIRPHFLLNTLNSIVTLSELDTTRMVRLLGAFSHYLQSSYYLKNLDKVVPLETEIELLESYLYIEKERFEERLRIKWEVDEIKAVMIPPLSIQTLVENAVNHGVLKRVEGGLITIRIREEGEFTVISVIDDGVGMDEETIKGLFIIEPKQIKGIGLMNTDQRLKQLFGKGLQVSSTPGAGTVITFRVPTSL